MRHLAHPWARDFGGACLFGGGGSTNTIQNTTPWPNEQPYLQSVYANAANNYQNNTPQYYPGQQVAPLNPQLGADLTQQYNTAMQGGTAPLLAGNNYEQNTLNGQYLNANPGTAQANAVSAKALSNPGNATAQSLAAGSGFFNSANPGIYQTYNNATANPASKDLSSMASGSLVGANAPGFQNVINSTLANVMPQIESTFAGSGRMNSGDAASAAAQGATNAVGNLEYQNYNTQLQNQLSAAGQLGQNYNTGIGNQLGASGLLSQNFAAGLGAQEAGAGLQSQNYNTGIGNQLGAAGLTSQNYQGALNNQQFASMLAPQYDNATMSNYTQGANIGNVNQQLAQQNINANMNAYNYQQMLPYTMNQLFENAVTGTGVPSGSTTTSPYYSNLTGNLLGGAAGVAALGSAASAGAQAAGYGGLTDMLGSLVAAA